MALILVTGGAGFIGANFVRYLVDHTDAEIIILDKLTYAGNLVNIEGVLNSQRVKFVNADISDRPAINNIFSEYLPDNVVNFAAESHVDRSIDDPSPFIQTNIVGTFILLEAARKILHASGKKSDFRFLHVSTDEVYGSLGPEGAFREDTPYAPNSPYSASKASSDHLVRSYHETFGLPTIITNCSNNYGPYQFPEKLIPLTLLNALDGKTLPIYGDGQNVRDWLYVEDHCAGIFTALKNGRTGEQYNIGGGNERANIDIVDRICEETEKLFPAADNAALRQAGVSDYKGLKKFVTDRPGHDKRYAIDSSKIQRELGWQQKYDFESGLAKTVRWYKENLDWCKIVLDGKYERERLGANI